MTTTNSVPNSQQLSSDLGSPDTFTNVVWAALVIALAGAPVTQNNVNNFTTWMTSENAASTWTGTAGKNNPLNNGLGSGGGSGLGSYPDLMTAAYYAAKGIEGGIFSTHCGGSAPGGIAAALKANAPFPIFQQSVIKSGWAGSCYSGSGFAGLGSAAPPPAVSVTQAAKSGSTHGPSVGNAESAFGAPQGALSTIGSSLNSLTGGVAGDVGSAISGAAGLEQVAAKVIGEVSTLAFWERFGMGILGVGLIVFGSVLFFSSTKTGQKAVSEAETAAPLAAAA